MGPGFKYHVMTIAAIFFALTLGLVVGSLYVSPQVADGQKRAITGLRETINKNVADQRAEIERYQKFVATTSPLLIQNRMKGEPVAIIQTGDYPDAVERVRAALTQANARIVSVTHLDEAFNRSDDRLQAELAALKQDGATPVEGEAPLPKNRDELTAALAAILTRQGHPPDSLLPLLEDGAYLHLEPDAKFMQAPRYVIIVAGSRLADSTRPANVDAPLIAALQKTGVRVIACEPQNPAALDSAAYQALGVNVAVIENVDSDLGPASLIIALRGAGTDADAMPAPDNPPVAPPASNPKPKTQSPKPKTQNP